MLCMLPGVGRSEAGVSADSFHRKVRPEFLREEGRRCERAWKLGDRSLSLPAWQEQGR